MTHADDLRFAYTAYRHRLRELFPRTPVLSFDDWLDDRECAAARQRGEQYLRLLGAEGACLEWAEGYLEAKGGNDA